MSVRNMIVRFEVIKTVTAYKLNCMVSCNLPSIYSLKFDFSIHSFLKFTGNSRPKHNII